MTSLGQIRQKLETGTKEEKIKTLESLTHAEDSETIKLVISKLDDDDIQVRGEAFSSLLLNESQIDKILITSLKSSSKNIRGFSALVLANRNCKKAIQEIADLADDESSMVRSCAVGALGYLKARDGARAIERCLGDPSLEVRRSAIKSAIDLRDPDLLQKLAGMESDDPETARLLSTVRV